MMPASSSIADDDLQAFVDDRLPSDRRRQVEVWLDAHPEAKLQVAAQRAQRDALRVQLAAKFAESIPTRLRLKAIAGSRGDLWRWRSIQAAAAVVIFAAGATAGLEWHSSQSPATSGATQALTSDSVAAFRTYVVEVAHPVEVAASDQDHLLKWLSRRLGSKLTAPDLGRFGYHLVGGRLLPAGESAAAMLMYETQAGVRLTVYIRAGEGGETAFRFRSEGEVSTFAWLDRGFGFAVSAVASRETLRPIVDAVYHDFETR